MLFYPVCCPKRWSELILSKDSYVLCLPVRFGQWRALASDRRKGKKWVCGIYLSGSFLGGFLCQQKFTAPLRSPLFVTFIFQVLVTFSFTHAFVLRGSDNFASVAGGPRILSSSCWFPYTLPIPTFVINPFIKSLQIMLIGEGHLFPVDSLTSKPHQVKIPWESAVPHWLT